MFSYMNMIELEGVLRKDMATAGKYLQF